MEKEFLAQYFYNEGVRRFKLDGKHFDYDTRASYFLVSYNLCVELSFFPEFFSGMCLDLAKSKINDQAYVPDLKDAIAILQEGKKHCSNPEQEKEIDLEMNGCQARIDEIISSTKGISDAARQRFRGIERLEDFWGEGFSFHDCWISKFDYDQLAGTITLDLVDPDADYRNPEEWATLRFNGIKDFTFNTERGNDYIWQVNTKITKYNNWLQVEFESAHLEIICDTVDVLEIHK